MSTTLYHPPCIQHCLYCKHRDECPESLHTYERIMGCPKPPKSVESVSLPPLAVKMLQAYKVSL